MKNWPKTHKSFLEHISATFCDNWVFCIKGFFFQKVSQIRFFHWWKVSQKDECWGVSFSKRWSQKCWNWISWSFRPLSASETTSFKSYEKRCPKTRECLPNTFLYPFLCLVDLLLQYRHKYLFHFFYEYVFFWMCHEIKITQK